MSHDPGTTARSKNLGFVTLFLVELWERFGYYGMTAVIVLFMVQRLAYSDDRANLTFGAFTALAYAIPAAGGYIGDKLLGSKRTMVLGALVLAGGYSLLAVPDRPALLFPALALVAVGGGIFKANPANLISRLYEGDPARIDSAFTMYYMAVNVGATASQIANLTMLRVVSRAATDAPPPAVGAGLAVPSTLDVRTRSIARSTTATSAKMTRSSRRSSDGAKPMKGAWWAATTRRT